MSALRGARVAVTRAPGSEQELCAALAAHGAQVRHFPLTRTLPPPDPAAVQAALDQLQEYAWLVFTSATGVSAFHAACAQGGHALPARGLRVAAVGSATAAALAARGIAVDVVPDEFVGLALPVAMAGEGALAGARVLLPRSALGHADLPAALRAAGAVVDDVAFYDTGDDDEAAGRLAHALDGGTVDVLTFAAPSAVQALRRRCATLPPGVGVVVIGPTTAAAARAAGWRVDAVAEEHTVAGLTQAALAHWRRTTETKHATERDDGHE